MISIQQVKSDEMKHLLKIYTCYCLLKIDICVTKLIFSEENKLEALLFSTKIVILSQLRKFEFSLNVAFVKYLVKEKFVKV